MKKKIITAALSLAIAIGFWMYVVMVIGPEYKDTFRNVEVKLVGELNEDFMILGDHHYTIDLVLSGNRSDLNKLNSSNILVELDQSKIQEVGRSPYRYEVQVPDTITIESRSPAGITLEVVRRKQKTVDIEFRYDEDLIPLGYGILPVEPELEKLEISGPEEVVDQIAVAVVNIEITDKNNKTDIEGDYDLIFLDDKGKIVDDTNITRLTEGAEQISAVLPIRVKKDIPLKAYVNEGGGVTKDNVTIEPQYITILGTEEDLRDLNEWYINDPNEPIDLSELTGSTQLKFPIDLPKNIKNKSGYEDADVTVSFEGLTVKKFVIKQEQIQQLNTPDDVLPKITEQQITVYVRGVEATVEALTEEDILVSVDFTNAKIGSEKEWKLNVSIRDNPPDAGVIINPDEEDSDPYAIYVVMLDKAAELARQASEEAAKQKTEGTIITLLKEE